MIPLEIVKEVLSATKRFTQLRLYLYINCRSNGAEYLTPEYRRQIADDLGLSERYVLKSIRMLEYESGWIRTINKKAHHYMVMGFRKILERKGVTNYQCAVLDLTTGILRDKELFNAWLQGCHIAGLVRWLKGRWKSGSVSEESLNGSKLAIGSKPSSPLRRSFYWPLAADYIAKTLGVSISTASEYRSNARDHGFIELKHYRRELTEEEIYLSSQGATSYCQRLRKSRGRVMIDGICGVRSDCYQWRRMTTRNDKAFINKRKAARRRRQREKENLKLHPQNSERSLSAVSSSAISSIHSLSSTLISFDDVIN